MEGGLSAFLPASLTGDAHPFEKGDLAGPAAHDKDGLADGGGVRIETVESKTHKEMRQRLWERLFAPEEALYQ